MSILPVALSPAEGALWQLFCPPLQVVRPIALDLPVRRQIDGDMDLIQGRKIWDSSRIPGRVDTRVELTDLVRFKDHWYCGFCEGEIHCNHPTGRAWIIRSRDGEDWEPVVVFDWDAADVRDPVLSVTSEGWLMVNTSLYFVSREGRTDYAAAEATTDYIPQEAAAEREAVARFYQLDDPGTPDSVEEAQVARQSVTWLSADGVNWSSAHACPSGINTWRWQAKWNYGMGYSVGYCGKDKNGTLYRTRDGKTWRVLLADFFPDGKGTECTMAFDAANDMHCLLRLSKDRTMCGRGPAPFYRKWTWQELKVDCGTDRAGIQPAAEVFQADFGGPKLIRLTDGRFFAAARMRWPWRDEGKVTLFEYEPEKALLTIKAELDGTSYPGLVEHEGELWVTFGRQGAKEIHLARIPIPGAL